MSVTRRFIQLVKSRREKAPEPLYGKVIGPGPVVFKKVDTTT